ncbi:MAG: hypothetical protein KC910_09785 [Candidatus Eremiobacteraeota bacterium]|nr:hypothetical protein [Candidatus Eremiobacteraeota bacterium]
MSFSSSSNASIARTAPAPVSTSRPVQTTALKPAPSPAPAPSPSPVSNQTSISGEALRSEGQSPIAMKSALYSTYSEPLGDTGSSGSSGSSGTNGTSSLDQTSTNGTSSLDQTSTNGTSSLDKTNTNGTSSLDQTGSDGTTPLDQTTSGPLGQTNTNAAGQVASESKLSQAKIDQGNTPDPVQQKATEQVKEQAAAATEKPDTQVAKKPASQTPDNELAREESVPETGRQPAPAVDGERRRTFGGRHKERSPNSSQNRPRPRAEELVGATRLQNELLAYFRPGQIHQSAAIRRVDKKADGSRVTVRADGVKVHQDKDGNILSVRSSKGKSIQRGEDDPTRATIHQERGELYQRESTGAWVDSEGNRLFGQLKEDDGVIRLTGHCGKEIMEGQRKDGVRFRRDSYGTDTWSYAGGVEVKRETGGDMFTYHADGSTTRTTSDGRGYHRNNTAGRVKVLDANQRGYDQDGTHFYTVRNGEGMLLEPNGESYERQSVRPDDAM